MTAKTTTAMTTTQQQAKPTDPVSAMKQWISRSSGAFAKILPKHVSAERFLKVAHAAITKTPRLAECDPRSVIMALIHCSELGLEPNSPLGHAYLIPFKNRGQLECQLQIGWKGLLHLAKQSGELASIGCYLVYDKDQFVLHLGDEPRIEHEPFFGKDRGKIRGGYMVAKLNDGSVQREVMAYDEIMAVKARSPAVRGGSSTPWDTDEGEMCRKTVFKRGSKWLPLSPEKASALVRAVEIDNKIESGQRPTIDVELLEELPAEVRPSADDDAAETPQVNKPAGGPVAAVDQLKAKLAPTPAASEPQQVAGEAPTEPAPPPAADEGPKRAPRRTPQEALADSKHLEAELLAEVGALHTLDECTSWEKADTTKARYKRLYPAHKKAVDEGISLRVEQLEAERALGGGGDAEPPAREPGSDG